MGFVVRLLINAIAIWMAAALVTGISIATDGRDTSAQVLIALFIALVFTVVNTAIKPVVKLLSIPLLILTLGLFTLVINALMLLLTAWITDSTEFGLSIDGFSDRGMGVGDHLDRQLPARRACSRSQIERSQTVASDVQMTTAGFTASSCR